MNASPSDQRLLLDVAELDTRIRASDTLRRNPPQAARVQQLIARRQELSAALTGLLGTRDDLKADLSRIESDVAVVDARRERDAERLAHTSNVKEAQGLESELGSLARRKSDLEDAELAIMEQLEEADSAVAAQQAVIEETNGEGSTLSAEAKRVVAEASAAFEAATRDRVAVAARVPADLLALYDRVAQRSSGAALLRRGTCERLPHGAGRYRSAGDPSRSRGRRGHLRRVRLHPGPHGGVRSVTSELIVEADGGSRGNPGVAAGGAVVLDAGTGAVLAEIGEYVGTATNNVAEYRGMLAGLTHALNLDPGAAVRVRMDSKLVVEQMSGRWKIKHPDMRVLADRAAALIAGRAVTFEWVPRLANARADAAANESMDRRESFVRDLAARRD